MLSALTVIAALVSAELPPAAEEGSAAPTTQPAPPSAADTIVAAAFKKDIGTAKQSLNSPSEISTGSLMVPALALIGLAGLAFTLTRRKAKAGTGIRVIESASLGPKRALIIAEVLGERLVLGVSEAGITVLATKPIPAPEWAGVIPGMPQVHLPEQQPVLRHASAPQMGFFERLRGKSGNPSFESALNESIEDQELRAKLAAGMRGVVP